MKELRAGLDFNQLLNKKLTAVNNPTIFTRILVSYKELP